MWKGLALSLLRSSAALARTWFLILFLGKAIGLLPSVTVLALFYLALLIPIPAALGSHDAIQAFAFGHMGIGAHTGAAFALVIRVAELILAFVGAFFFLRVGTVLVKSLFIRKASKVLYGK